MKNEWMTKHLKMCLKKLLNLKKKNNQSRQASLKVAFKIIKMSYFRNVTQK